uniref:V-SNARE coiled-coil homology domain-containing protein n=1 Tax=Macrostomum lignano TaxID=282301 RepID=A0A1I8JIE2_9PLAT
MRQVVGIMRVNVEKVMQRDEKISDLNERADALQAGASRFEASAGRLKRKYWWQNTKVLCCELPGMTLSR